MGNDSSCEIFRIRNVLSLYDDGSRVNLINVRNEPNIKRYFISISYLDNKGVVYKAQGGVLGVYRNDKCLIKGQLSNCLYFIIGSIINGSSTYVSDVCKTILRHKR